MNEKLDPKFTELPIELLRRRQSFKWRRFPDDVLPAWVAEMDFPLAKPIKRALVDAVELDDCGYSYPRGLGLGDAFADFARWRMSWEVNPDWVFPAIGLFSAIWATLGAVVESGDRVVVSSPSYLPFETLVRELGCIAVDAPLVGNRLDPDAIRRCLADGAAAVILCSPHNPTGGVPAKEELAAVAESAAHYGSWVLADEAHAPLTFAPHQHTPFLTVCGGAVERSIAFYSASKPFNIAGLKCAEIVVGSEPAANVVRQLPARITDCGHLGAIASAAAFRDGEPWLTEVTELLEYNSRLLDDLLTDHLPEVAYMPPQAGYLAWLDLRRLGLGWDPAAQILERGRLALSPGLEFGAQGTGFARLNFATSPEHLEAAVVRLKKAAG